MIGIDGHVSFLPQKEEKRRMCCHRLPRDIAAWAGITRLQRICNMCQHRIIGHEKHMVFECPALQDLRDKRPHLLRVRRQTLWY